jgi:Rieske 2Fe-2S family protein
MSGASEPAPDVQTRESHVNHVSTSGQLEALVNRREPGHTLEGPFYTSQEIYDLDVATIFGQHWLFCATEAEIPEPGDFVTVDIGPSSVIILRDDDEEVRAFRNVCRHRGSTLLQEPCGSVGNIVCPYHQWTYRGDGHLIFAESLPETFDKSKFSLKGVNVRTVAGLIFLCLADEPPADFDDFAKVVEPFIAPYGLANAKVAYQSDIPEDGNWKLVMENNRECYHCDASHPELLGAYYPFYRYTEDDVTPRQRPAWQRFQAATADLSRACALNRYPEHEHRALDSATGFQISRLPLTGDGASYGPNGAALCKRLIGSIPGPAFGDLSLHMQPNSWFHFLSDHAVVFRVLPVSPDKSVLRTTWLVHADAVEGEDYDVDSLTAVWRTTNDQDRSLVAGTQKGVANPAYVPGPYSEVEEDVNAFVSWYVARIAEQVSTEAPVG